MSQLKSILDSINYYSKETFHQSYQRLWKDTKWNWSTNCVKGYKIIKENLLSAQVLTQCDTVLTIKLYKDASNYGIGAVVHIFPDESELTIAFASRTLNSAEKYIHR